MWRKPESSTSNPSAAPILRAAPLNAARPQLSFSQIRELRQLMMNPHMDCFGKTGCNEFTAKAQMKDKGENKMGRKPKNMDSHVSLKDIILWNSSPMSVAITALVPTHVSFYCTNVLEMPTILVGMLFMVTSSGDLIFIRTLPPRFS